MTRSATEIVAVKEMVERRTSRRKVETELKYRGGTFTQASLKKRLVEMSARLADRDRAKNPFTKQPDLIEVTYDSPYTYLVVTPDMEDSKGRRQLAVAKRNANDEHNLSLAIDVAMRNLIEGRGIKLVDVAALKAAREVVLAHEARQREVEDVFDYGAAWRPDAEEVA